MPLNSTQQLKCAFNKSASLWLFLEKVGTVKGLIQDNLQTVLWAVSWRNSSLFTSLDRRKCAYTQGREAREVKFDGIFLGGFTLVCLSLLMPWCFLLHLDLVGRFRHETSYNMADIFKTCHVTQRTIRLINSPTCQRKNLDFWFELSLQERKLSFSVQLWACRRKTQETITTYFFKWKHKIPSCHLPQSPCSLPSSCWWDTPLCVLHCKVCLHSLCRKKKKSATVRGTFRRKCVFLNSPHVWEECV